MNIGSRLVVKGFHIRTLKIGTENLVKTDGTMTVNPEIAKEICDNEPLIEEITIRTIQPDEHDQHTNTIMDVIPLSAKALGKVGSGITHTLTGVYVLLTGIDTAGRQVCNFGGSDGILKEKVAWGKAGTPLESDLLIFFDVVLKEGTWTEREGPDAAHRACDSFCQIFRDQMKKFNPNSYTEKHVFQEIYEPDRKDVVIVKEVSGQGAVYDTRMFGKEPGAFEQSKSVIDMGWMPVVVTPNEFRDGIMRAMD